MVSLYVLALLSLLIFSSVSLQAPAGGQTSSKREKNGRPYRAGTLPSLAETKKMSISQLFLEKPTREGKDGGTEFANAFARHPAVAALHPSRFRYNNPESKASFVDQWNKLRLGAIAEGTSCQTILNSIKEHLETFPDLPLDWKEALDTARKSLNRQKSNGRYYKKLKESTIPEKKQRYQRQLEKKRQKEWQQRMKMKDRLTLAEMERESMEDREAVAIQEPLVSNSNEWWPMDGYMGEDDYDATTSRHTPSSPAPSESWSSGRTVSVDYDYDSA